MKVQLTDNRPWYKQIVSGVFLFFKWAAWGFWGSANLIGAGLFILVAYLYRAQLFNLLLSLAFAFVLIKFMSVIYKWSMRGNDE